MTSYLYAIADAGGNVYPGTFSKDEMMSQCLHLAGGKPEYSFPCQIVDGKWQLTNDPWEGPAAKGDHVVYCQIETNETVTLTQQPLP